MDESAVQKTDSQLLQSPKLQSKDDLQHSRLNNSLPTNNADLLKVPKRKLSVFCRSFDVIEAKDQENTLEFRRTSSNPSVGSNDMQDEGSRSRDDSPETSPCRKGFVNSCRSLIENGKFVNSSSLDYHGERPSSPQCFPSRRSPVMELKLPRVKENVVDGRSTIAKMPTAKQPKLQNGGPPNSVDKNVANSSTEGDRLPLASKSTLSSESIEDCGTKKDLGFGQSQQAVAASDDLVKIKDPACPPTFVDASSAGRGKYITVGAEMSNQEDSSSGSESEDEAIEETRNDRSQPSSSFSIGEFPGEPDPIRMTDGEKTEDLVQTNREKRQVGNPYAAVHYVVVDNRNNCQNGCQPGTMVSFEYHNSSDEKTTLKSEEYSDYSIFPFMTYKSCV